MSLLSGCSVVCDTCGALVDGGKSPYPAGREPQARADATHLGWKTRLYNPKGPYTDRCAICRPILEPEE